MRFNLIILFLFIIQSVFTQEKTVDLKIEISRKEKNEFKSDYNSFENRYEHFYEDDYFVVKNLCSGEFGGTIEFKNKQTEKKYIAKATCPSSLIKLKGKYYLTTSLAHMSGFSGIYEINNPHKLEELNSNDTVKEDYRKKKSTKGLKQLYKNIGGTILLTFPYQDQLYYITSDENGTFLRERKDSELIIIKKLLDQKIFTLETEIKITNGNHYVNNFMTGAYEIMGFFDVYENKISINIYE